MKNCPICAGPIEDNARFCGNCGAKIEPEAPAAEPQPFEPQTAEPVYPAADYQAPAPVYPQPDYPAPSDTAGYQAQPNYGGTAVAVAESPIAEPKKKSKVKLFIIIGVSVVLVAAIVVTLILFWDKLFGKGGSAADGGQTIEEAFDEYIAGVKDMDAEYIIEKNYDLSFTNSDKADEKKQEVRDAYGQLGDTYKAIFKMVEIKLDSAEALSDDELKARVEELSKEFKDTDKITEIDKVTVTTTMMGQSNESTMEALKVDGTWYFKSNDATALGL